MPEQPKTLHPLAWYVRKMNQGERKCRQIRHDWPTDRLEPGLRKLPDGLKVIGEIDRLRLVEWCYSCGSEGTSFRERDGHMSREDHGSRRRITHGPDWTTVPREVEAWPRLIKAELTDTDSIAKLLVRAAQNVS